MRDLIAQAFDTDRPYRVFEVDCDTMEPTFKRGDAVVFDPNQTT